MKVVITDYQYENIDSERSIITGAGYELFDYQVKTTPDLIPVVKDADAVITQYSDINAEVIEHMQNCKIIIKYGIGVNNIDCEAASKKGIYVCNVPDYGVDEVSDHACTMLLALGKKLPILAKSFRKGEWGYSSVVPLLRLSECTLGLVGFGRIPKMVARKMSAFGMKVIAYDPYINETAAQELNVTPVTLEQLLKDSNVSLFIAHLQKILTILYRERRNDISKTKHILREYSSWRNHRQALLSKRTAKRQDFWCRSRCI